MGMGLESVQQFVAFMHCANISQTFQAFSAKVSSEDEIYIFKQMPRQDGIYCLVLRLEVFRRGDCDPK